MPGKTLILGANGRFGRNMAAALRIAGWQVHAFRRGEEDLMQAAQGKDVIVYGWNPAYPDWARQVPEQAASVIAAARAAGATVILPGNVYVFGADSPSVLDATTPHAARNPLGQIRRDLEAAFRASGVRTLVLRAGDFIDTQPGGNWFDMILTRKLGKGRLSYPGALDVPHAWAYLPDMARAAVALAEMRDALSPFEDVPFPGFTLTGQQLADALAAATGRPVRVVRMSWLPIQLARRFWRMARPLLEMRYLWSMPHRLDGTRLAVLLPEFQATPLDKALASAIQHQVDPDHPVPGKVVPFNQAA